MKKHKYSILGICFFILSALFIANVHSFRELLPSQEVDISHGASFGPLVKDFLFVQEVTLKKRYINRVDLFLANIPSTGPSENVFLVLDSNRRILYTKKISSTEIDGPRFYPVDFNKCIDIGKGGKLFVCINSIDGTMNNYLVLPRKAGNNLGKLYVLPIQNNDLISTLEKPKDAMNFDGNLGVRTYESDTRFFTPLQFILYLLVFCFSLLIIFAPRIKSFVLKFQPVPEYAFLGISLVFGFAMVFITPPFQVPDEPQHLYRSYQIADLNILKYSDSIPRSLVQLAAICDRMKFMAHEKTSKKEILELSKIKLNPTLKSSMESPNYTVPYLPQALGIVTGKLFHSSPLSFFYLGRIFNLLVSVVLLFMAIRTTPVLKWLFFALSILPMTLYQMSSLSYDAMTISLSFLIIAMNFNFAFNTNKVIRLKDILLLFGLTILIAACKPPYFVVVFSILIVPVSKIGSWKKFSAIAAGLLITILVISQSWEPSQAFFRPLHKDKPVVSETGPQPAPLPQAQPAATQKTQPAATKQTQPVATQQAQPVAPPQAQPAPVPYNPFDPPAQKKFILDDPIRYLGIIIDTFGKFIGLYLISFIGLFGWVDTPLPPGIIYPYLILLTLIAFTHSTPGIKISFLKKCILFSIFLLGFLLVETAMYVYCNPIGCNPITAVQGRYFLAFGPLFFIIFYNHFISDFKIRGSAQSKQLTPKEKRNQKQKAIVKEPVSSQLYAKSLPWFVMGFGVFVLLYSVYTILARFYIVLI